MSLIAGPATIPARAVTDHAAFRVLIAGGGLGGLCLAQGLKAAGVAFTVFERDANAEASQQGYPLGLNSDGLSALRDNLPSKLWSCVDRARSARRHGIMFVDEQLRTGSIGPATLCKLLLLGIEGDIRFNRWLTLYEVLPDSGVRCTFDDGSSENGNLLVACDGANSVQAAVHARRCTDPDRWLRDRMSSPVRR